MHFQAKNTLKNNCYHNAKHHLNVTIPTREFYRTMLFLKIIFD
jgi:hypothetical protein